MKAIRRLLSSSSRPKERSKSIHLVPCIYCGAPFIPWGKLDDFCSRDCLQDYNYRPPRAERRRRYATPPPPYPASAQSTPRPPPPYQAQEPSSPPRPKWPREQPLLHNIHPRRGEHSVRTVQQPTPVYATGYRRPTPNLESWAHAGSVANAVPSSSHPMVRASSGPAQPQNHTRRHRGPAPERPSSAGHTPGVALRSLPVVDPSPAHASHHAAARQEREYRNLRAPAPLSQPPAPADAMAFSSLPRANADAGPLQQHEEQELPTPDPRSWHFGPPPTPSVASTFGGGGELPTGGFYDSNGYPTRYPPMAHASWKNASSATLVPTPRPAPKEPYDEATPRTGHGFLSPAGGAHAYARPRPGAGARRGPRPRSNSFGGF